MKISKELLEKAKTAQSAEELLEMAKTENINFTAEEAAKAFAELNKSGELSDEELDNVSGGCGDLSWGSYGEVSRAEDVRFEFNVGDRVEVYNGWIFHTYTMPVTIVARRVAQNGNGYRPFYKVRFDRIVHSHDGESIQEKWVDQNCLSY